MSKACRYMIEPKLPRRPVNGLCVEIGQPATRCILKVPEHWPKGGPSGARWLMSGGDPLVFGLCQKSECPDKDVCNTVKWTKEGEQEP